MQSDEPYIPPFVRRAMRGATEADLLQATDNLRCYLKVMYALFRELESEKARSDSHESAGDVRFEEGADQPPQL